VAEQLLAAVQGELRGVDRVEPVRCRPDAPAVLVLGPAAATATPGSLWATDLVCWENRGMGTVNDQATLDEAESATQAAMLAGDVAALDSLLADNLAFVGPDGAVIGKADDLNAHRTGATRFERITEVDRLVSVTGESGTSVVIADVALIDRGQRSERRLRWERSSAVIDGRWEVVRGAVTPVAKGA
jgi:ketosteroid isomerase-like protein